MRRHVTKTIGEWGWARTHMMIHHDYEEIETYHIMIQKGFWKKYSFISNNATSWHFSSKSPLSKHEGMLDLFCPISSKFWFNVTLTKYGHIISLAVNEPVITWCNLWRVAYRYPAGSREGWERCKSSLRLQTKITHNNNNNIWNINL